MENPQRLHVQPHPRKLEAQWVVGFVDGEGCFFVGINRHPEMTSGFQVLPELTVVQHQRDIQLLHAAQTILWVRGGSQESRGANGVSGAEFGSPE